MPNRTELAVSALRSAAAAPGQQGGLWLVIGLCVIGALLSVDFAAYFQSLDQLPLLMMQMP